MESKRIIDITKKEWEVIIRLMICAVCVLFLSCTGRVGQKYPERDLESATVQVIAGATTDAEKIEKLFLYVRDEIPFNWVFPQNIPAVEVLKNGLGVCMQKANLLSAMLRQAGFQTRFRFMFVRKQALEDFLPGYAYKNWMDPFPHTVVEILYKGQWRSFDPSFDQKLYEICLDKKINFGRHPVISQSYKTKFSIEGMKGTQEFWEVPEKNSFYGDNLDPLMDWDKKNVNFLKRAMKPFIFNQAKSIMDKFRG
jgi:hypothetical protein